MEKGDKLIIADTNVGWNRYLEDFSRQDYEAIVVLGDLLDLGREITVDEKTKIAMPLYREGYSNNIGPGEREVAQIARKAIEMGVAPGMIAIYHYENAGDPLLEYVSKEFPGTNVIDISRDPEGLERFLAPGKLKQ